MVHAWARVITCTECLDTGCVEIAGQQDACPACTRHAERLWRARQTAVPTPETETTAALSGIGAPTLAELQADLSVIAARIKAITATPDITATTPQTTRRAFDPAKFQRRT
jgi:hypothetical protein